MAWPCACKASNTVWPVAVSNSSPLVFSPANQAVLFALGAIYRDQGNFPAAIGYYQKAVTIQPDNEAALANLGNALCHYSGFSSGNFLVVGVLDSDPSRVGDETPAGLLVEDAERIAEIVAQRSVDIGIITTPASAAQKVCDQMVGAGLRAILNFASTRVRAPEGVLVKTVDLKVHLEELCLFLAHATAG